MDHGPPRLSRQDVGWARWYYEIMNRTNIRKKARKTNAFIPGGTKERKVFGMRDREKA